MIPFHFDAPPAPAPEWHEVAIPAHLQSKAELLEKLATGLSFPPYFGHNWDALEECLGDLARQKTKRIVLIHADLPSLANQADRRVYLQILAGAAQKSEMVSIFFPASCRTAVMEALDGES